MKFFMTIIAYLNAIKIWRQNFDWDQFKKKYNLNRQIFPKIRFNYGTGYIGEYLVSIKIRNGFNYELVRVIYWKIEGEIQGLTSHYTILKDFNIGNERYMYLKWKVT